MYSIMIDSNNYRKVLSGLEEKVDRLSSIHEKALVMMANEIRSLIDDVKNGCNQLESENSILRIGVVGGVKAGKSSFLNSLFFEGDSVLPRASTPMTAGLTALQYGEENKIEVEYYNKDEWALIEDKDKEYKADLDELRQGDPSATDEELIRRYHIPDILVSAHELVSSCSRRALDSIKKESYIDSKPFYDLNDLQRMLENYVGASGEFTPITKCLTITLNDPRLKGIQIVDTPGVNDPVISRELRTREFLRGCHGVFFLSFSSQFFNSTDVSFLVHRIGEQGIGQVVLIASKFDSVLQDVGPRFNGHLPDAIDDCTKKLRNLYFTNIRSSQFKGENPIIDFSCGIGYSIYKKDSREWDAMEAHVASRMKDLYPSFFETEEELRETFKDLSKIDEIQNSYLDGVFSKRKVDIIHKKINNYFSNVETRIRNTVLIVSERLSVFIESIQNNDLEGLKSEKYLYEKVLVDIRSDLDSIAIRAREIAERNRKECLNGYSFRWAGRLPIEMKTESFTRITTFWENTRSFSHSYEKVDVVALIEDLECGLHNALKQLSEQWKTVSSDYYNLILDSIGEVISRNEKEDVRGSFNGHMLRNELDGIIDVLRNNAVLEIRPIEEKFHEGLVRNLQGKNEIYYEKRTLAETEAINSIDASARKCMEEIRAIVHLQIEALQEDISGLMDRAREDSISILMGKKELFIKEISDKVIETLSALEDALGSKEQTLADANHFQTIIKELSI